MRSVIRPGLTVLIAGLALSLAVVPPAAGQRIDATLFGSVSDPSGARLPGVTVTAMSPALIQGQISLTTGPEGSYRFQSLQVGTYQLLFELQGFQTVKREGILLQSGQSLRVDASLTLGQLQESVTVTGDLPIIDTRNAALVNIQSQEILENIPLRREFQALVNIMPGVSDARYGFAPTNIVHGSTPRQSFYAMDGLSFNDAIQSTTAFTLPVDAWEEIQITTAGVSAEFGDQSGATINYVSKSGGNEFSGGANFYFSNQALSGNNLPSELQGVAEAGVDQDYEVGGTLGGPIAQDKAWFFTNYRYTDQTVNVLDFAGQPSVQENSWFTKGTWQASSANSVQGTFYYWDHDNFPWADVASFRNSGDPRVWMGIKKEVFMITPRWTSVLSDNTLLDVTGSYMVYKILATNPNEMGDPTYLDAATGVVTGGDTHSAGDNRRNRHQLKADLSHFLAGGGGEHSLKFGVLWQSTPVYQEGFIQGARGPNNLSGCSDRCINEIPDTVHLLFNGAPFRVRQYNAPVRQNFGMKKWAAYAQDQWVIKERVTLNLGLRWDYANGDIEASPQGGGIWQPEVIVFPEQSGVIDLSTVSPRFGLNWDVTGEQTTTVRATAGRFYHNLGVAYLQPAMPAALAFQEFDWIDRNGDLKFQSGEEGALRADTRVDPNNLPSVDPDLKNGYTNVFTVGVNRRIGEDWAFQATGIFKRDSDIPSLVNTTVPFSAYVPITVTNPLNNQPLQIFTLPTELQAVRPVIDLTNPADPDLRREYNGLELVANRRMKDNYQMQVSYVWGKAEGNISNQYGRSDYGRFTNPNDYVNRYGQLSMSPEHQFKVFGAWVAPYGLVVSGFLEVRSGLPITNTPNFMTGVQGAPTVRFFKTDFPQIQSEDFIDVAGLPAGTEKFDTQTALDFRVEYRFDIGMGRFSAIGDIFNVFNSGAIIRVGSIRVDSPAFLAPSEVQRPRQFRLGIKWDF